MASESPPVDAPIEGVLLDLDGTIMDSQEGILETMRHTLTTLGVVAPPSEELLTWIGPPFPLSLRRSTTLDESGIQRAIEEYRDHYIRVGSAMAEPFPGMVELIRELAGHGVVIALATSKPRTQALGMLDRLGLLGFFSATGCASDDETRGTKSEVIEDALAELVGRGLDPSGFVMVGDRIHDFEAAREHGLVSVAVEWGYGNEAEWAHADVTVETPNELRKLLLDGRVAV